MPAPAAVIVEPDDTVRAAIVDVLCKTEMEVIALARGWDVFLLPPETRRPVILVTDINLGAGLDGFKLATAVRCRWHGLPVIGISSPPLRYRLLDHEPCNWFRMEMFSIGAFVESVQGLIAKQPRQIHACQ